MASSPEYSRMREAHCRTMAANAKAPQIRKIHESLADRYAEQAGTSEGNTPRVSETS